MEQREPKREASKRRQTRIGQDGKRDHNGKAQQEPSSRCREHDTQREACEPGRKERAQDIERRSPIERGSPPATRQEARQ